MIDLDQLYFFYIRLIFNGDFVILIGDLFLADKPNDLKTNEISQVSQLDYVASNTQD